MDGTGMLDAGGSAGGDGGSAGGAGDVPVARTDGAVEADAVGAVGAGDGGAGAAGGVLAAVRGELAVVAGCVERLRGIEWSGLSEDELLTAAREVESMVRSAGGVQVRLAGEVAARGVDGTVGARSPAHVLSQVLRVTVGEAKGRIAAAELGLPGRSLTGQPVEPEMSDLVAMLDSGEVSGDHARVVTSCLARIPAEVDCDTRALCGRVLLDEAAVRDPNGLRRVAEQVRLICDPDGTVSGKDPVDRAELHFGVPRSDGLTSIRGLLDPLCMEQLRVAVEDLAAPSPIDGDTPDPRPAPVRRAQALGEVLARYLAAGGRGGGSGSRSGGGRPQVGITIAAADLAHAGISPGRVGGGAAAADLAHAGISPGEAGGGPAAGGAVGRFDYGGPVAAATACMLGCDGSLVRLLIGDDGAVLDQGRGVRLFTAAQRRALIARDKGCAFPGCDIPANWCEAHHITFWSRGGPTDLANGVLLCRRHHVVVHQGDWCIEPARPQPRGRPWFIPPKHIDPDRRPRRNESFRLAGIRTTIRRT